MITIESPRLSVALNPNKVTVLFGPTGVGKSTVIRQIAGHQPLDGSLIFEDQTIDSAQGHLKAGERKFAYLSQKNNLIDTMTVADQLNLIRRLARKQISDTEFDEILAMTEISDLLGRHNYQLSGGETQLVGFAMMLLNQSRWLLLDEPFSALDKSRLKRLLLKFRRWLKLHQLPVLYVTHDVNEVAMIADDVVFMSETGESKKFAYKALLRGVDSDFITQHHPINVIQATWIDSQDHLQRFQLDSDIENIVWAQGDKPGLKNQWLAIPVSDISLAQQPLPQSSILNQIAGHVHVIGEEISGYQYVSVAVGTQIINARLTSRSCRELNLDEGKRVYVCFKTPRLSDQ
jgi:molybdate transport system ATP-binding protein